MMTSLGISRCEGMSSPLIEVPLSTLLGGSACIPIWTDISSLVDTSSTVFNCFALTDLVGLPIASGRRGEGGGRGPARIGPSGDSGGARFRLFGDR